MPLSKDEAELTEFMVNFNFVTEHLLVSSGLANFSEQRFMSTVLEDYNCVDTCATLMIFRHEATRGRNIKYW